MRGTGGLRVRLSSVVAVVAVVAALAVTSAPAATADTAPEVGTPATVSADELPTTQINGVAWTQLIVGNTVYVGGDFSSARPAGAPLGTGETPRSNLLAYNLTTGVLIASFAPTLNGQVLGLAASPDGSRLYVAGEFTTVNGVKRNRIAAFDTASGSLVAGFAPNLDYRSRAIVVTDTAVYVGGAFNSATGNARTRLAAFNPVNGAVLPWAPTAEGGQILSMVLVPDGSAVVVGGQFTTVNGASAYGMAKISLASGALLPWAVTSVVRNGGANAGIYSLSVDGTQVYGTGYTFGSGGNFEGTFAADAATGNLAWVNGCRGDTYASAPLNGVLYSVGHAHDCSPVGGHPQTNPTWTFQYAIAATTAPAADGRVNSSGTFAGRPAAELLHWLPTFQTGDFTGQSQATWDVVAGGDYVLVSGEFPTVNGVGQQGLTRFAARSKAPNTEGPQGYSELTPTLQGISPGTEKISWTAAWDRDNKRLTYEVIRDSVVIATFPAESTWWNRPTLAFTDTSATPGSTPSYRVRVSDALDNRVSSTTVSGAVPTGSAGTSLGYANAVAADGASSYWRLGEANGTTATNWSGADSLTVATSATRNTPGALSGDSSTATTFSGATGSSAATTTSRAGLQRFSVEAWFRTTSTSGGKIVGWGSSSTGSSANADRHVYMTNSGQLVFGVNPGSVRTVTSPAVYNDGAWHQVVATLGVHGMVLWVDGVAVASRADTRQAQGFSGFWRVGGDAIGSAWPTRPTSAYLNGAIDEVAVYPTVLDGAAVNRHLALGRGVVPNASPTARLTSSVSGLTGFFNGSTSTDPDGTVTGWAWTFGDGTTGTGATPTHAYAAAGTYPVTLTVTDNRGATGSTSGTVTVTAPVPNVAPTASFTSAPNGLTATVDGSVSTDPDGTVVAWAWTFGDGGTATGVTASHVYAAAGTYPVTLTVTDDDGATGTRTGQMTVTQPPGGPTAFASDTFGRTTASGLGSAEVGGAWTTTGTASSFWVSGGAARIAMPGPGSTRLAVLGGVSHSSTDVTASISLDTSQTGGGTYVSLVGRRVGTNDYRLRVRYLATGEISLQLARAAGSTDTVLTQTTVAGLTPGPGAVLNVRLQVSGTGTTTLAGKVWVAGTTEPAAWRVTTTDTTAALQAAGSVGISSYLSGSSTGAMTLSVDDLVARPL